MKYYLYHIPGKKIGVTTDLKERVENQQGYNEGEYEVIMSTEDIELVSKKEISLQKALGYRVDRQLYKDLHNNNFKQLNNMNINITEMTTTFPCPISKLKGRLMDNKEMSWETEHGRCFVTNKSIDWIMDNVKTSQYTQDRCYIYNKAFARWFENNDTHDQYNSKTRTGALSPCGIREENGCDSVLGSGDKCPDCDCNINPSQFDLIRQWANERGLYENGDPKTQALKLVEEVGETCRAILKENDMEIIDGIGDCVVVLTNLAELIGEPIEECIEQAYNEIKNRKGKMANGTYVKDA